MSAIHNLHEFLPAYTGHLMFHTHSVLFAVDEKAYSSERKTTTAIVAFIVDREDKTLVITWLWN